MSVFVLNTESYEVEFSKLFHEVTTNDRMGTLLAGLANCLYGNNRWFNNKWEIEKPLHDLALAMQDVNATNYGLRYKSDKPAYTFVRMGRINRKPAAQYNLCSLVKFLDCYEYNSSDYAEIMTEEQRATLEKVKQLKFAVMDYIVSQLPEYKAAAWG
jgi:hypothetical protein